MRRRVRTSIRQKLALAMAVPLVALTVVSGLEVVNSIREARAVREQAELAQTVLGPDGILNAVQNEMYFASSAMVGLEKSGGLPVTSNAEARWETDSAAREFRATVEGRGGRILRLYQPAFDELESLEDIRAVVDTYTGPRDLTNGMSAASDVYERYTTVVHAFFDANTRIAELVDDTDLRTGTQLVNLAGREISASADLARILILSHLEGDGISRGEAPAIGSAIAAYDAQGQAIVTASTGEYRPIATRRLTSSDRLADYRRLVDEAVRSGRADVQGILAVNTVTSDTGYPAFRDDVAAVLDEKARAVSGAAGARERLYMVVAGALVLLACVATWLTSRSITRPMASLTRQATDVAKGRLPGVLTDIQQRPIGEDVTVTRLEPVEVAARDEVLDVAQALTSVQDTAVELAVEQALLRRNLADAFVSLGRRNQNLLSRQLDYITELERDEVDPESLASLFQLDHLATRMRRNAESLLVLAGIEPPRTWAAPIPITDVIRSALGEVAGYERVVLRRVEPTNVAGRAASDLSHLVAELVENALRFSPQHAPVDIHGQVRAGGYVLAVVDAGFGMPPDDVERANRRLAGGESFTIAPSSYLGHYVAGHLAARHGVGVRLDSSNGRGTVATITLPPDVLSPIHAGVDRPGVGMGAGAPGSLAEAAGIRTAFVPAHVVGTAPLHPGPGPAPAGRSPGFGQE